MLAMLPKLPRVVVRRMSMTRPRHPADMVAILSRFPKRSTVGIASTCSNYFLWNEGIRCLSTQSEARNESSGIAVVRKKGKETGYCYGCGADLIKAQGAGEMKTVPKKKGYWNEKKEELKKSKLKNWALCPRCAKLQKLNKTGRAIQHDLEVLSPSNEMMLVFREQVSKIRTKENAVVVLCVDAVNISGTLIKSIRNYVGGNPILLAVTRCDLLPSYIWDRIEDIKELKQMFLAQASHIQPANAYLCSEDRHFRREAPGIQELADDLWDHLNGRDPYIVGAANIGKSTLTDILISNFSKRVQGEKHLKRDRLAMKRFQKLKEARITKSSLPGTTLQNVRVPCFSDHTQALWDTPGLVLDESLAHFPIRNLRTIRAQRPTQVQPILFEEGRRKSFALLICEKGDDLPLLRFEVRLKKNAEGEGPVRLVWNSTLNLDAKIVDLDSIVVPSEQAQPEQDIRQASEEVTPVQPSLSKEEKAKRKEERRRIYEEKIKQEQAELGQHEWNRLMEQRKAEQQEAKRKQTLAQLDQVHEVILEGKMGVDISIANFGWLGILLPRTALIRTYAPSSGVRVTHNPTIGLPVEWDDYDCGATKTSPVATAVSPVEEDEVESDEEEYDEYEEEMENQYDGYNFYEDCWEDDFIDGHGDSYGHWEDDSAYDDKAFDGEVFDVDDVYRYRDQKRRGGDVTYDPRHKNDIWKEFSGKNVGWQFDADGRFIRGNREEGWNPLLPSEDKYTRKKGKKNKG